MGPLLLRWANRRRPVVATYAGEPDSCSKFVHGIGARTLTACHADHSSATNNSMLAMALQLTAWQHALCSINQIGTLYALPTHACGAIFDLALARMLNYRGALRARTSSLALLRYEHRHARFDVGAV